MNCAVCHQAIQPIRRGRSLGWLDGEIRHADPADCVRATARRCIAIFTERRNMDCHTEAQIRNEFELKGK